MTDQGASTLYYVLALVLVASSLIGMRLPLGKALKMVLAWVAIFGVVFALFAFRSEFSSIGQRLRAEATGTPILEGEAVRIPVSEDGHFYVTAKLNGRDVRFMVDSGASITTVSRNIAEAAGMPTDGYKGIVSTANGDAPVTRSWAQLRLGTIERPKLTVHINEQEDVNLLGMNFLSSLNGWRVEGNYLVLQP
jgi:aspartyl protease family protein